MWTNSLLKRNSRFILKAHLLYGILAGGIRIFCTLFFFVRLILPNLLLSLMSSDTILKGESYYFIWSVSLFLFLLARVFIGNALTVGLFRYYMEQRQGRSSLHTIFGIFTAPTYWNVIKQMFLRDVQVIALSILFIIPGIYRSYQLRLVPWLLAENPALLSKDAFSLSSNLVRDEILHIVCLDISFIGWLLLSCCTFGLGLFWFFPYYWATLAEFYAAYRVKAFSLSLSTRETMPGFTRPEL